jgi:hypothetical protein
MKAHYAPYKNYSHRNINFACGCHILDYFCPFQVYCINFKLKLVYFKETTTNIYKLEHTKYICVKNTCHKIWKLQIYFKINVIGEVLQWIFWWWMIFDTPPISLMDSTTSPKVKTVEGEVEACSLICNISRVERHVEVLRWGLGRLISKSNTYTNLHKPNNKLVACNWSTFGARTNHE